MDKFISKTRRRNEYTVEYDYDLLEIAGDKK